MFKTLGSSKDGVILCLGIFTDFKALTLLVLIFRGLGRGAESPTSLNKEIKK